MNTTTPTSTDDRLWLHECGAIVLASHQPDRCGTCWSALRNRQAHNGHWQPTTHTGSHP